MINRLTVLTCPPSQGQSICPVCGAMVPDYCQRREDDVTPEAVRALQEEANKDLAGGEWVPVDGSWTVTDCLPKVPATDTPKETPAPVSEPPKPPVKRRKQRGGK